MVTTEILDNLKSLQTILVEKYDLEKKIADAPKQLSTQEDLLARLKEEFIKMNTEYEDVKSKVLKLQLDLEEAVKSRESGEKGMDDIQTHREYEALEKQIKEATDKENEVRKDLQKEEKNKAELNESLKNHEELIKSQEAELNTSKESLNKQLSEYQSQLDKLKIEENKITPNLDQEILFKFERIIQRNSEGIVTVRNGVCSGCHMILPAQFANIVHNGEDIMFCPYCSRILYHEEVAEDQAESFFDIGAAGTLAGLDYDLDEDNDERDEDEEERDEEGFDEEESEENEDEDLDSEDSDIDDEEETDDE